MTIYHSERFVKLLSFSKIMYSIRKQKNYRSYRAERETWVNYQYLFVNELAVRNHSLPVMRKIMKIFCQDYRSPNFEPGIPGLKSSAGQERRHEILSHTTTDLSYT
jgi:hypothetical protein